MARKAQITPAESEATFESLPVVPAAKAPAAESATVQISAEALSEVLGQCLYIAARLGVDVLGKDGHGAYLRTLAEANADGREPADFHAVDARDAYHITQALMETRSMARRAAPTRGETELRGALVRDVPELVARLDAAARKRPARLESSVIPERPMFESLVILPEPHNRSYPNGQYFDHLGRPIGPKPKVRTVAQ